MMNMGINEIISDEMFYEDIDIDELFDDEIAAQHGVAEEDCERFGYEEKPLTLDDIFGTFDDVNYTEVNSYRHNPRVTEICRQFAEQIQDREMMVFSIIVMLKSREQCNERATLNAMSCADMFLQRLSEEGYFERYPFDYTDMLMDVFSDVFYAIDGISL